MQMVDMECEHRHDNGAVQPVKIVAGNKCDLKEGRMLSAREGLEWARQRGCGFMETSAREMVNIEETFARRFYQLDFSFAQWSLGTRPTILNALLTHIHAQSSSGEWSLPVEHKLKPWHHKVPKAFSQGPSISFSSRPC